MLADHSPTQMGARWIDHDLTQFDGNIVQVLIVTGGRTPDPNDSYSTMPIETTELLLPAASSWVRRRKVDKREKLSPPRYLELPYQGLSLGQGQRVYLSP